LAALLALMLISTISWAAARLEADTGECQDTVPASDTLQKTPEFVNQYRSFRAYGTLTFRRVAQPGKDVHCHVVFRLLVSQEKSPFREVLQFAWDTEGGEIAAVELVGLSEDRTKFAADFTLAEGDGQQSRPVVYDLLTEQTIQAALEDKIQKLIHGCDQNEDFIGVTNSGEAIFAVPPSVYADTPECGDKGLWHFNLKTGKVYRVKRFSGVKWQ
jgi:hypothetical protein